MKHTKRFLSLLLSLFLLVALAVPGAGAEGTEPVTRQTYSTADAGAELLPPDELLMGYLEQRAGVLATLAGTAGRDTLAPLNAAFYDILRSAVEEIAAGKRTSTAVDVTPGDLGSGFTLTWTGGDVSTHLQEMGFDTSRIFHALLADLPFDFYWFNSSSGGMSCEWAYFTSGNQLGITKFTFRFAVSPSYSAGTNLVRSGLDALISTVQSTAASIVAQNSAKSDYEKLFAYKEAICALVTYDHAAAASTGQADKNPWQLMNVFDGDPDTNVVCEGYSKAFMYLCDLSTFSDPGFACYLVHGDLLSSTDPNPGPHMWNHVTLGGSTYLVDVTNCDENSIGSPDYLFMREAVSGYSTPSTGYQIQIERDWQTDTASYIDVDGSGSPSSTYYGGSAPFLNLATTPFDSSGGGGGTPTPVSYTVTAVGGSGGGDYTAGTTVTITADAAPAGKRFAGWDTSVSLNLSPDENSETVSFVMPAGPVILSARYEDEYGTAYTVTVYGGGGGGTYYPGDPVRIWADPVDDGKTLSTWILSPGVEVEIDWDSNDLTATFTMPDYDVSASVMYEEPDGDGTRAVCIEVEEDAVTLRLVTKYELNGTLMVSAYDADGYLLSTGTGPCVDGVGRAAPDLEGAAFVTAFVVDDSFRPLTAKVTADV